MNEGEVAPMQYVNNKKLEIFQVKNILLYNWTLLLQLLETLIFLNKNKEANFFLY